jgi:hypothetical protein
VLYVDANKSVGDADHIKAFASRRAADEWFNDNDPKGVAFEYESCNDQIRLRSCRAKGRAVGPQKANQPS